MLKEYEVVALIKTVATIPVPRGTTGTVLIAYGSNPGKYEVEFVDEKGRSLGTYTVEEEALQVVG